MLELDNAELDNGVGDLEISGWSSAGGLLPYTVPIALGYGTI